VVSHLREESGKGRLGCLFTIMLVALLVYVGKDFAAVYFRYYQIDDEVKTQAGFAPALTDAAIRDRLVQRADSLDIVIGPKQWRIQRLKMPSEIVIEGTYADSVVVDLPLYHRVFHFHFTPGAHAPL
jgi:hypothetical protein